MRAGRRLAIGPAEGVKLSTQQRGIDGGTVTRFALTRGARQWHGICFIPMEP